MRIEFIMPVMRPKLALLLLDDLAIQTQLINKITIVDNGGNFKLQRKYPFEVELISYMKNIGVNAVWNKMFDIEADYIGLIGDDYRLDKNLIKILINSFKLHKDMAASTATIFKKDNFLSADPYNISGRHVSGKGHMGAIIFRKCILDQLPLIPKEFFIFFGDNWLGWWIDTIGYKIYEVSVGISEVYKTDLKDKLDYPTVIENERDYWKDWLRSKIEL